MIPSHELRIESLADSTRERWGLRDQKCPDVITMLFKLKHERKIVGYELVADIALPDDEAEYNPLKGLLRLRHSVFQSANDLYGRPAKARARFTLAHEFGHIILNHTRIRHRNISDRKIERIVTQTRIDEAEANRFAGALLIPRHLVDASKAISAEELAIDFQVSESAARVRADELQRMRRRSTGIKRELPQEVREFLLEAKKRGAEIKSIDDA
jgi:hypothetical protein